MHWYATLLYLLSVIIIGLLAGGIIYRLSDIQIWYVLWKARYHARKKQRRRKKFLDKIDTRLKRGQ